MFVNCVHLEKLCTTVFKEIDSFNSFYSMFNGCGLYEKLLNKGF